jgi:hypothetical protein
MNRVLGRLRAARTRTKIVALSTLLVLTAGAVAIAAPTGILTPGTGGPQGIVTVGPVSATNGFPDWYRDTNGVDLMPCTDPQDKFCGGAVAAPDNTAPITFPDNFPDEFFYMSADADALTSAGGNNVLASYALEGAFANGGPTAGDQIVFTRIRYRINAGLQPNTDYKVTHPYGTDTVTSDADGALFVTQDVGVTPGDFSQAIKGRVGPFLTWASSSPTDVPPAGYIGDGVTPHAVTGSELGTNFVRITGPGIAGAAGSTNPNPCNTTGANAYSGAVNDCIQTNNFVLVGKKSTTAGVDVSRATYDKSAATTQIQVLANSKTGQDIVVRDGDNPPGPGRLFRTTALRPDGNGHYMARVNVPGALPKSVDVVNRGDVPVTVKHVDLTDKVSATAVYHTTKGSGSGDKIHVTATSSDSSLALSSLTLPDYGDVALDATGQKDIPTAAPLDEITVKSAKGGSVTVPVTVDGQLPLLASAGPDQTVAQGAKVSLDGNASSGDIDTLSWAQTSGTPAVTLTGDTTATPTFTAPATATTLTFTVTVKSGTETKTDDVVVKVNPTTPARAQITPVGATVLQNLPLTLDGTTSLGAAKYEWSQVPGDQTQVTLGGDTTSSKLTFLYPKTTTPIHVQLRVRSATDPGGTACSAPTCDTAIITLTPLADNLQNIRAKFDGKGRWVVDGTATVQDSNNVRVYAGATIDPTKLIGSALVDPTNAWKVDVRNSPVALPACRCVSVESDRGGKQLSVPVN